MTDDEKKNIQVMEFAENAEENPDAESNEVTDITPGTLLKRFMENKMYLVVAVLGVALVFTIIYASGAFTGLVVAPDVMSADEAGQKTLEFVNSYLLTDAQATLNSVEMESGIYKVFTNIDGQEVPIYATMDGKFIILPQGIIDVDEYIDTMEATENQPSPTTGEAIPKSDKPVVQLFIWSYCPYGVQAQGPMAEVASLLGNDADFRTELYYDGHGAYETQQNKIQACIQEVDKEKYWEYAAGFVKDIYPNCGNSRDVECDKDESVKLMKSLGIDDSAVMSCVEERGEELIAEHRTRAGTYGVTGSPSTVINGLKVNVARNAEAFKAAICSSFNTPPEECDETLSAQSATTGAATC